MFPARVFARAQPVAAQVAVSDIADAFYGEFATEETGRYWWWCREILIDPNELIVEGNNQLYRLSFTIGDDGVTFGEPREVRIQYVDALTRGEQVEAALTAIASVRGEKVAARFHERPISRPQRNEEEGGSMDLSQLRSTLNLSADTPDEEVLRIAAQRLEAGPEQGGGSGGNQDPPPDPDQATDDDSSDEGGSGGGQEGGTSASVQEGRVVVDAAALAELQRQASDGAEARRVQVEAEVNRVLDDAIGDGKIPPSRRAHYARLMEVDPEGTRTLLSELADNVIPIAARGDGRQNGGEGDSSGEAGFGYPAQLLPEVEAKKQRIAAGSRSRVMTDRG